MKIQFDRKAALEALAAVAKVSSGQKIQPVLSCVKLWHNGAECVISAFDLEVGAKVSLLQTTCLVSGSCLIPADRFLKILRELTGEEVLLEGDNETITISDLENASNFELPGCDVKQFPEFDIVDVSKSRHSMTGKALRQALENCGFCVATDQGRYGLTGVMMVLDGDNLEMVGTDGRRLSQVVEVCSAINQIGKLSGIVPSKATDQLLRMLHGHDEDMVTIQMRTNDVLFQVMDDHLYSLLINGLYPDYKGIWPKSVKRKIEVDADELLVAVKQAAIMTDKETQRIKIELNSNTLTLSAQGVTSGRGKVQIGASVEGEPMSISVNPFYLREYLETIKGTGGLTIELIDENKPITLKTHSNAKYQHLIMPLS